MANEYAEKFNNLFTRVDAHVAFMESRELTRPELQRAMAITAEQYQEYIDLLEEVAEEALNGTLILSEE